MREGKQICPRITRIDAKKNPRKKIIRVNSRDWRASLFVLNHSDCARKKLIRRLPDAILTFMPESSYPCHPCNPWFLMLYSCPFVFIRG
jgi:hypothetical protein